MKISLTFILLIFIFFSSCKKEDEFVNTFKQKTFIEGHLYRTCEGDPYQNLEIYFYERRYAGLSAPKTEFIDSISTDSNGYFYFDPGFCYSNITIIARDSNNRLLFANMGGSDAGYSNYDYCNEDKRKHKVKIRTNKPFTNQDTLIIWTYGNLSPALILVGPFQDNQVAETVWLGGFISEGMNAIGLEGNRTFWWGIGMEESTSIYPDMDNHYIRKVRDKVCGYGDTVVVDLNKR